MIQAVAHRGASSLAPENTLAAFRKAKELGADAVELDVHLSADGALVVHHDYALGHPDDGEGLIRNLSLSEIKGADAGSWFAPRFAGERIPVLEEVFSEFGGAFDYEIELKGTTPDFLHKAVALVKRFRLLERVQFTSPHTALLSYLMHEYKEVNCGMFFYEYPDWMSAELGEGIILDTAGLMPVHTAHLPCPVLTGTLVAALHKKSVFVHASNCNTREEMQKAICLACDQFSTDDIQLAKTVIG